MDESLGVRLRQQRERQQVALATIAEQTKIKLSLLEGLERDDVSRWPEGIFRRAFVRAYARAVGLDPDPIVREFLDLYPDSVEAIPAVVGEAGADGASVSGRPPMRLRYLVASGVAVLRDTLQRVQRRGPDTVGETAGDPRSGIMDRSMPSQPDLSTPLEHGPVWQEPEAPADAQLFAGLDQVLESHEVGPMLENAAKLLDAVGLIVWSWEPRVRALEPTIAHGYSDAVLSRFPRVRRDSDNAIAAAFRSAETRIVNSAGEATGAVVVPLMAPKGCVGVLALELRHGGEQRESVLAMATIMAAQLATVVGSAPMAEAVNG